MYFDRKVNSTNHANPLFFTIRNLSWFSYPNEPFIPDFLTFIYNVTAGFSDQFKLKKLDLREKKLNHFGEVIQIQKHENYERKN